MGAQRPLLKWRSKARQIRGAWVELSQDCVGPLVEDALKIAGVSRLAVHGPEDELAKLRAPWRISIPSSTG